MSTEVSAVFVVGDSVEFEAMTSDGKLVKYRGSVKSLTKLLPDYNREPGTLLMIQLADSEPGELIPKLASQVTKIPHK